MHSDFKITNITACFTIDHPINLHEVADAPEGDREVKERWKRQKKNNSRSVNWTKSRLLGSASKSFQSVKLRIWVGEKFITALLYKSGAIVLVGASRKKHLKLARNYILRKFGCGVKKKLTISNYAFSCKWPAIIPQEQTLMLARKIPKSSFDPELFPSLLLCLRGTSVNARLFRSGSIIITGCKKRREGKKMLKHINTLLNKCD